MTREEKEVEIRKLEKELKELEDRVKNSTDLFDILGLSMSSAVISAKLLTLAAIKTETK